MIVFLISRYHHGFYFEKNSFALIRWAAGWWEPDTFKRIFARSVLVAAHLFEGVSEEPISTGKPNNALMTASELSFRAYSKSQKRHQIRNAKIVNNFHYLEVISTFQRKYNFPPSKLHEHSCHAWISERADQTTSELITFSCVESTRYQNQLRRELKQKALKKLAKKEATWKMTLS